MPETMISGENLYKAYRTDKSEIEALVNVSINIPKGNFAIIMGPSGSGKSTLLNVMSSLDRPDEGRVLLGKKDLFAMSGKDLAIARRNHIGFIFQDFNLIPNLSILENLLVPAFLLNKNRKENIEKAKVILERLDITSSMNRSPSELSGGQQQRAAVARSLMNSPDVIIADEPTGSLNSSSSARLLDLFTELNEDGQTILMVTHDLKAACQGEQIFYMKDGRIDGIYNRSPIDRVVPEKSLFEWLSDRGW